MQFTAQKFIIYTITIFMLLCIGQSIISYRVEHTMVSARRQELGDSEQRVVNVNRAAIVSRLNRLASDALFIRDDFEIENASRDGAERISKQWASFLYRRKIYCSICFTGSDGQEKIKIGYDSKKTDDVPHNLALFSDNNTFLKKHSPLSRSSVYISKLELNKENGIVQIPYRPVIRFDVPCFAKDGGCVGFVTLVYSADDILNSFKTVFAASRGLTYLVNADGYWLYNTDEQTKAWSFMFPDQFQYTAENDYPSEWKRISKGGTGTFITKNGLFSYADLKNGDAYGPVDSKISVFRDEDNWYLFSRIAPEGQNAEIVSWTDAQIAFSVIKKNVPFFFIVLILSFLLAYFLVRSNARKEHIKYMSEFDAMTGVYNRQTGIDKINDLRHGKKAENHVSFCFVDVNGLKKVNDTFGHEAGDELLKTVVDSIKQNVRPTDYVIRMGGDEFLIVLDNAVVDAAEMVWKRISDGMEQINSTQNRKYIVSASHGIVEWLENKSIESTIEEADSRMYEEKREIKKTLEVIR